MCTTWWARTLVFIGTRSRSKVKKRPNTYPNAHSHTCRCGEPKLAARVHTQRESVSPRSSSADAEDAMLLPSPLSSVHSDCLCVSTQR